MEVLFKKTNLVIFSIPFRICRRIHFPSSTVKYSQAVSKSSFRIPHMPPNREASSRLLSHHLSPLRSRQNHAETTQFASHLTASHVQAQPRIPRNLDTDPPEPRTSTGNSPRKQPAALPPYTMNRRLDNCKNRWHRRCSYHYRTSRGSQWSCRML
jgi:hypothetical protein